MATPPYALLLVDLGGVVVEFDTDRVVHHAATVLGRSFDEVQRAVYRHDLLLPFELGQITPEDYYRGLKAQIGLSWSYEQFVRAWNDIFHEQRDVTALVDALRARHTVMALTNTNALHLAYLKTTIPLLSQVDGIVASCEVGLRKPDPAIYRLALERAGFPAQAAVYIDDRPEFVEAGRAVGLTAIRFTSSQQLASELRALGLAV